MQLRERERASGVCSMRERVCLFVCMVCTLCSCFSVQPRVVVVVVVVAKPWRCGRLRRRRLALAQIWNERTDREEMDRPNKSKSEKLTISKIYVEKNCSFEFVFWKLCPPKKKVKISRVWIHPKPAWSNMDTSGMTDVHILTKFLDKHRTVL